MQQFWQAMRRLAVVPFIMAALPASAQDYPSKPITIIVPFAAGGSSDIFARKIGEMLQESWGKPVVVESRAGGNAVIGSDYVARSAPDGHTMLLVTDALTINAALQKSLPYDTATAFAPITMMASTPLVLVAHPSLGVKSVAELVTLITWMKGQGFDKVANSPDEFKAVIVRQMETWSSVIKQLGIEQQ